jgi:hypothetical protein
MSHKHEPSIEERLTRVETIIGLRPHGKLEPGTDGPVEVKPEHLSIHAALLYYAEKLEYAAKWQNATGASYADYAGIATDLRRIAHETEQYGETFVPRTKKDHAA